MFPLFQLTNHYGNNFEIFKAKNIESLGVKKSISEFSIK